MGDGGPATPEPLRFGERTFSPEHDAARDEAAEADLAYRAPRPGLLRRYRAPLLLAGACLPVMAVTWLAWAPVLDAVSTATAELVAREGDGQTQVTVSVALVAVALLGFVVAWARATHPRRAVRLSGERGRMAVDVIAGGLRDAFLELRDVREAEVSVQNRGRGRVLVRAWLRVSRDARIDDTLDEVDDAAEWLIRARLGLELAEPPLVDVRYDELDLRAARRGRDEDE
jgi:hypothetical protein